ncbi:hypothetical protein EUX98_g6824 [Antrodiella citrinella]|uniref:Peptidase A1 domain-containing protein n=1 Tax=Antrodiella citrinella TaxID=2447956 RepID=A0A4S4MNU4_9APHY|nr:hypothetical protein EUX98_g6824 [Antrodiella citrinella]
MHRLVQVLTACLAATTSAALPTTEPKIVTAAFASYLAPDNGSNSLKRGKTSSFDAYFSKQYLLNSDVGHTIDAITSNAVLKPLVTVKAGDGQTFKKVLIDTGSAIIWLGGQKAYKPGRNSHDLADFGVQYGAGGVSGRAYTDKVTIGDATVKSQIIGASNDTSGFGLVYPIDGILGLGPSGSNAGQIFSSDESTPTFVENLVAEGTIDKPVFGIYINGLDKATGKEVGHGEITFGGVDQSKFRGNIDWIPQLEPYNFHWEFNVTSLKFGNQVLVPDVAPARSDTGVLPFGLPFDAFIAVMNSVPGGDVIASGPLGGLITFPANVTQKDLPSFTMQLGKQTYSIPPAKYLIPKGAYAGLNLTVGEATYTWITSGGRGRYALGQKWLESVYTVYDMEKHRVGFAPVASIV